MQAHAMVEANASSAGQRHGFTPWRAPTHIAPVHASDPLFLGHALTDYQAHTGLGDRALAARLGCSPACLPRLALRRCPQVGATDYEAELVRIEEIFGARASALSDILRTLAEIHHHEGRDG